VPGRTEVTVERKQPGDAEAVVKRCAELEAELHELKAQYEQYFLGLERHPPTRRHEQLKKAIQELRTTVIRQTAAKFRVATLAQKLTTYERLWDRTIKEIEAGTYVRDLFKARLHRKARDERKKPSAPVDDDFPIDEDLDLSDLDESGDDLESAMAAAAEAVSKSTAPAVKPAAGTSTVPKPLSGGVPPVKPVSGSVPAVKPPGSGGLPKVTPAGSPVPNPAPRPGAPPRPVTGATAALQPGGQPGQGANGVLSEQKIKAIYDAYVMAKKRCGEDTRNLTLEAVSAMLRKQVPELMKQHNAKSVEFKVVIKDGKAILRALPRE
jgi:hypothetical protein